MNKIAWFAVYDIYTGKIQSLKYIDSNTLSKELLQNRSFIEVDTFDESIIDTKIVDTSKQPPVLATTIDLRKKIISAQIDAACKEEIYAGFTSSALGSAHHYPANDKDQLNLSGSILRSLLPSAQPTDTYLFWCMDSTDTWAFKQHTAAQIQQVGVDAYNAIMSTRAKNETLQTQIRLATTQGQLDVINW